MVQVLVKVGDVGVDGDLVFPLKLSPHLTELGVGAGRWHYVVHDVDVYVVEHDAIAVTGGAANVIHWDEQKNGADFNPLDARRRLTDFSQTSYAAGSRLTYKTVNQRSGS